MPKKRYNAEDIVRKLCETDVLLSQGMNISQICKRIGIADQTYYRWRKVYGGMKVNLATRRTEGPAAPAQTGTPVAQRRIMYPPTA